MKRFSSFALLLSSLLLSACLAEPPQEAAPAPIVAYPFVRLAPSSPPDTPFEEAPVNFEPQKQVWRKGHWSYDGKDFTWVSGVFIERPHPTAAWTADRWEKRQFGFAFIPGYWQ